MQRYNIIFTYPNELTLIKFFLYFYTFSLTHTYARTLYKASTDTQRRTSTKQKTYICVYLGRLVVCLLVSCQCKKASKSRKAN